MPVKKSMSAAERASADSYAGPHHSFPLYSSGAHLRAAWNLAGHSADPEATRAKIRAFAAKHGLTGRLPKTAQKGYVGGLGDFSNAPLGDGSPAAPQLEGVLSAPEGGHGDFSNAPGSPFSPPPTWLPPVDAADCEQPEGALGVTEDQSFMSYAAGDQPHGFLSDDGTVEEQPVGAPSNHPAGEGSYLTSPQGYPGFEGDTQRSSTNSRSRPTIPPQGPAGVSFAGTYSPGRDSNWTRSGRPPIQGQDYNVRSMGSDSFQADDQGGAARNRMGPTPGRTSPGSQNGARKASITAGLSRGGIGANNTPRGSSRVHQAVSMAYDHAERADGGPDGYGSARSEVIDFAHEHDLMHHLPERAHGYMHRVGHPHRHPGERDENHVHVVRKAFNVVGKSITIEKAWGDGDECFIEGWVSTNDQDLEKDIVEPEAFKDALNGYAERRMPLSSEHQTHGPGSLPIGHGQRLALVRDGIAFKSTVHPTDPAEFEHFPNRGTGVYGRFVITDPTHAAQVKKGNIGGFSWIGNLTEYEPLATGGRRYLRVDPWLESTVAAFPVNSKAVLLAAKAYEAELAPQTNEEVSDLDSILEELLAGAAEANEREQAAEQAVSKADLQSMFGELSKRIDSVVSTQVQKAVSQSREGVGRVGGPVASSEPTRDDQPGEYIVRKANAAAKAGEDLSPEDKALAWGIMEACLSQGLH